MSKKPETTFELVHERMKKAHETCRSLWKLEAAALWRDALEYMEYQQARIAELEQQVAELSKDKARLDLVIKYDSPLTFSDSYVATIAYGDALVAGASEREAIDAAIVAVTEQEQNNG